MNKLLLLAVATALALSVSTASAARPHAHASSTTCKNYNGTNFFGSGTYLYKNSDNLDLTVSGTSCKKGLKVAKGYGTCGSSKSSCSKTVKGFKCSQKILQSSGSGGKSGSVSCHKGKKKVTYGYGRGI